MPQALYRKWRPQTWDEVVGQDHVVVSLRNALAAGKGSHAYLFAGPRGTGKTTLARILAKAVNCLQDDLAARPCGECAHCQAVAQGRFLDLIEIDAASNTSVDDVRDLRDKINFSPNQGRFKIYIIDEVHMLSTSAFNALLKTLEEPPPHAIFVLATTEVHKIPATVLSRCQHHEFRRIPLAIIVAQLEKLAASEGIQAEPEALTLIARQSTGALRDAISLLDQLASTGQAISLQLAQEVLGTATSQSVLELVQSLIDRQPAAGLDLIHQTLDAGSDPRQFARQLVDYLRGLLLISTGNASQVDATLEIRRQMELHAQALSIPDLLRCIRHFNQAANEKSSSWQASLPLELALLEVLEQPVPQPQPSSPAPPAHPPVTPQKPAALAERPPTASQDAPASPQDRQNTQTLADSWKRMLNWVRRQNPQAYGLLNSCKSRYMRGDMLVLYFASDVVKNLMEKPDNLEITRQALQHVFQRPVEVQVFVDTAQRDSIPQGAEENGMVAAALRDLGGEIVDIQ